jgi:alpha-methylacyl-CoA racemase
MPGATIADSAGGGMHAAISILAALVSGEGAYLDVSTTDGALFLTALAVDRFRATGERCHEADLTVWIYDWIGRLDT